MHGSFAAAQLSHDLQQHPACFVPEPETTPAEALRGRVQRAAQAGEKFLDSVEVEVNEVKGDCQVVIKLWGCSWEERAKLADALEVMAREIRPFQQTK